METQIIKQLEIQPTIIPVEDEVEIWKESSLFPLYEVSSFGRVRNKETKKIRKPRLNHSGYNELRLNIAPKKAKDIKVHQLVAKEFCVNHLENEDVEYCVDHIDQCVYNNYYKNLRYVTRSENFYNTKAKRKFISRTNVPVALVDRETGEVIEIFASIREASQKTGLNEDNISYVIHKTRKPFKIGKFVLLSELTK